AEFGKGLPSLKPLPTTSGKEAPSRFMPPAGKVPEPPSAPANATSGAEWHARLGRTLDVIDHLAEFLAPPPQSATLEDLLAAHRLLLPTFELRSQRWPIHKVAEDITARVAGVGGARPDLLDAVVRMLTAVEAGIAKLLPTFTADELYHRHGVVRAQDF